jgi:hypothetical protein
MIKMKKAKGEVKKLIVALGEIQNLVGKAKGSLWNDRDANSLEEASDALDKAFEICLKHRNQYDPL